jgi:hypothetical protein
MIEVKDLIARMEHLEGEYAVMKAVAFEFMEKYFDLVSALRVAMKQADKAAPEKSNPPGETL